MPYIPSFWLCPPNSKILLQGVLFPCVYSKAILKLNKHFNLMSVQASEPVFSHPHQLAISSLSYKALLRAENLSTLTPVLIACFFHSIPCKFLLRFFEKRAFFFPNPTMLYMKQKSNGVNYSECSPQQAAASHLVLTARMSQLSPGPLTYSCHGSVVVMDSDPCQLSASLF